MTKDQEEIRGLLLDLYSAHSDDRWFAAGKLAERIAPEEPTTISPYCIGRGECKACTGSFCNMACVCDCHKPAPESQKPEPEKPKAEDWLDSSHFETCWKTLGGRDLAGWIRYHFRPDYDQIKGERDRCRKALEKIGAFPCQSIHQGCGGCLSCIARAALKESD